MIRGIWRKRLAFLEFRVLIEISFPSCVIHSIPWHVARGEYPPTFWCVRSTRKNIVLKCGTVPPTSENCRCPRPSSTVQETHVRHLHVLPKGKCMQKELHLHDVRPHSGTASCALRRPCIRHPNRPFCLAKNSVVVPEIPDCHEESACVCVCIVLLTPVNAVTRLDHSL